MDQLPQAARIAASVLSSACTSGCTGCAACHTARASPSVVSPLGWEHIGLTGDYLWREDLVPLSGTYRELGR